MVYWIQSYFPRAAAGSAAFPAALRGTDVGRSELTYEIDEIRKVPLGGLAQKIHIRAKGWQPVLLFLHGGPGISNRDSVINRERDLSTRSPSWRGTSGGTGGSYWGASARP